MPVGSRNPSYPPTTAGEMLSEGQLVSNSRFPPPPPRLNKATTNYLQGGYTATDQQMQQYQMPLASTPFSTITAQQQISTTTTSSFVPEMNQPHQSPPKAVDAPQYSSWQPQPLYFSEPPNYEKNKEFYESIIASADLSQSTGTSGSVLSEPADHEFDECLLPGVLTAANQSQSYGGSESMLSESFDEHNFQYYDPDPADNNTLSPFDTASQQHSLVPRGHRSAHLNNESYAQANETSQSFIVPSHSLAGTGQNFQPPMLASTPQIFGNVGASLHGTPSEQQSRSQYPYSFLPAGNDAPITYKNISTSGRLQETSQNTTFGQPTTNIYIEDDLSWLGIDPQNLNPDTSPAQSHDMPLTSNDIDNIFGYNQSTNPSLPPVPLVADPTNSTQGASAVGSNLVSGTAAPVVDLPRCRIQKRRAAKRGKPREKESVMDSPDGHLLHKKESEKEWHPAIYHHDIRMELLEEQDKVSTYYNRGQRDLTSDDRVAAVQGHEYWGEERADRPRELFMLEEPPKFQPVCKMGDFMHNNLRVLDRGGKWMRHWDDVPRVCPHNAMEGWESEALTRRNPDLQISDLLARMKDPPTPTAVTNRMMRFRKDTWNISWGTERGGSKAIDRYVFNKLPQESINSRSTEDLDDMTDTEFKEMEAFVARENLVAERAKAAEKASKTANNEVGEAQESTASVAESSLRPPGDFGGQIDAATPGSDSVGPDVTTASELPDRISIADMSDSETIDIELLQNQDAASRSIYAKDTTKALDNVTIEGLASRSGPANFFKTHGRRSSTISNGGKAPKSSKASQASTSLTTKRSVTRPSKTVSATKSKNKKPKHSSMDDSCVRLEYGKIYVLIDTDKKEAHRHVVSAEGNMTEESQNIDDLCLELANFNPNSLPPTAGHCSSAKTVTCPRLTGLTGVSFYLITIDNQIIIRRYYSVNGPSYYRCKDAKEVLQIIMSWTSWQPTRQLDPNSASSSMMLKSHPDSNNGVKKASVSGSLQKEMTQTYPINIDEDIFLAPSLHGDIMPQESSHGKGQQFYSHNESSTISDISNGSSGFTEPSAAFLAPASLSNTIGHMSTDKSPKQSGVISKPSFPDFSHLAAMRSLISTATTSSSAGSQGQVRNNNTVPSSNNSSGSTVVSESVSQGKKRSSEYMMNPASTSEANMSSPFTARSHNTGGQDIQPEDTHKNKKPRTESPESEPAPNTTNSPTTELLPAIARARAYFAEQERHQREQQYANRDRMLQIMLDSGIPAIVAAAQRNKNNPIDSSLHPAHCSIKLTDAEANEMNQKMGWLPLNFSYIPEY